MSEQVVYGPLTHLVMRERHCGERRMQLCRKQFEIVEPHDSHIVRYRQAQFPQAIVRAHSHAVAKAEQSGWPFVELHKLQSTSIPGLRSALAPSNKTGIERYMVRLERLFVSLQSPGGCRYWIDVIYETDSAVAFVQKHFGR